MVPRVRLLHVCVLALATRDLDWVTSVERTLALGFVVVFHDVRAIVHLDAVVVDSVCLQRTVKTERRLGLAFEIFVVVFLGAGQYGRS